MTKLRKLTFSIERIEILPPPPQPEKHLMLTLRTTKIELPTRRINLREEKTKIDLRPLIRTAPPRFPKSKASMTREKELMADFSRLLLLSDLIVDPMQNQ